MTNSSLEQAVPDSWDAPAKKAKKDKTKNSQEELKGQIARLFFESPEFSAGIISTTDGKQANFSLKGQAEKGGEVTLVGKWITHPKYGLQFEAKQALKTVELSAKGLARWLSMNRDFENIGPKRAKILAEKYASEWEHAITNKQPEMAAAAGVQVATIEVVRRAWQANKVTNEVSAHLAEYELTQKQIETLLGRYGDNTVSILQDDPYTIVRDVKGYGFKRVDKIARRLGMPKNHPGRIRAGVYEVVEGAVSMGHCYVEMESIFSHAVELLVLDDLDARDRIYEQLQWLLKEKYLVSPGATNETKITTPGLLRSVNTVASFIDVVASGEVKPAHKDIDFVLDDKPNEAQHEAIMNAIKSSASIITGGAGVGKTFTLSALARNFVHHDYRVVLGAPTGKAARRMEQLGAGESKTIHRLLEYNPRWGFQRNEDNPIDADVVIIDESSMLDIHLLADLLCAINLERTSIIFVGDHNQLPPVGPGFPFRDLCKERWIPAVELTEVMRQSGPLKKNCVEILQGVVHKTETSDISSWYLFHDYKVDIDALNFVVDIHREVLGGQKLDYHPITDTQVLTPQKKGVLGANVLNVELQMFNQTYLLGNKIERSDPDKPTFYPGDKVIQTENNYDLGVMNGTIGYILTKTEKEMLIQFEGEPDPVTVPRADWLSVQLAYAITIHKSQGSEFPCVICVIHKAHTYMHHRNLFYTAATRSKKCAIVVGDGWGIRNCAKKRQTETRQTLLPHLVCPF